MEQAASGGVTVGAGFQKKYIVDAITQGDLDAWFAVFGGVVPVARDARRLVRQELRQFGHKQAKKAQAGAAIVTKQIGLIGLEVGENLIASERQVVQVCVDSEVFSCAKLSTGGAGAEGGEAFAVVGSASFEALRKAVTLSVPAYFSASSDRPDPSLAGDNEAETPVSRSKGGYELDKPMDARAVSGVQLPEDPVLLRWCEKVEHQRKDGGAAYAQALADYRAKAALGEGATEAWLGHVMMNDWPTGLAEEAARTVPYVEAERGATALVLRLPVATDSQLRFSLHTVDGKVLLLASGPAEALLPRCSSVLLSGEPQPLDGDKLATFTTLGDAMAAPAPPVPKEEFEGDDAEQEDEDPAARKPRVLSFAQRWLEPSWLETSTPAWTGPDADEAEVSVTEALLEEHANFSLKELTLLGHVAVSPPIQVSSRPLLSRSVP